MGRGRQARPGEPAGGAPRAETPGRSDGRAPGALLDRRFWESRHRDPRKRDCSSHRFFLDTLLVRHLPRREDWRILEVGCVPGGNLVYFARRFGYRVAGIDFSEAVADVGPLLWRHGVRDFEIHRADLFSFRPPRRYEVVFSAGFVEHFRDPHRVFRRHVELLAPGGFLVVTLPNLRGGQALLRRILGSGHVLEWHNLDVMRPPLWESLAREHGLDVLFCGYRKTFSFWLPPDVPRPLRLATKGVVRGIAASLRALRLDERPNRYLSPHIALLARRPPEESPPPRSVPSSRNA